MDPLFCCKHTEIVDKIRDQINWMGLKETRGNPDQGAFSGKRGGNHMSSVDTSWRFSFIWGTGDMALQTLVKTWDFIQVWWETFGGVILNGPISQILGYFPFLEEWKILHTQRIVYWMSKRKGRWNKLRNKKF